MMYVYTCDDHDRVHIIYIHRSMHVHDSHRRQQEGTRWTLNVIEPKQLHCTHTHKQGTTSLYQREQLKYTSWNINTWS